MSQSRILVVRAGAVGDTLMVTPLLPILKQHYSAFPIDFLCSKSAQDLLVLNPHIETVFPLRWRNLPLNLSFEKRRILRELRRLDYRFAVLLEDRPHFRRLLEKAGIDEIRDFQRTPFNPGEHSILNNLRAAGLREPPALASLSMEIHFDQSDRDWAIQLLEGLKRPLIGLHMGYSPNRKKATKSQRLKAWSHSNFRAFLERCLDKNFSLVLTGSEEDSSDAQQVTHGLPTERVRVLTGRTTLRQLAALIDRLQAFVSVDSGPAHMAAAIGTPLIVLWGPAILEQVQPISTTGPVRIVREPVPCAPCYNTPTMQTCQDNICMQGITPTRVFEELEALLGRASK